MAAKTYTTIQGDSWDSIAYRLYGEERLMQAVLKLNQDYADVLIFQAGTLLKLPDIAPKKAILSGSLPPWVEPFAS